MDMDFMKFLLNFHVLIPYSVQQYVFSGLIMFVSAEVLKAELYASVRYRRLRHLDDELRQNCTQYSESQCHFKLRKDPSKMVAFGKTLRERQIKEWKIHYLDFTLLKESLKQYVQQIEVGH
ncbi:hypothetical protein Nepgr_024570 [Nepenthes gracilis]|uniref:Uncharacterized protein n=1 Tax=Nepenthes gracilis TaxID=150966 RepID=A0AAD3T659_NEPGR|nr:hypothetical protein Nepgr_024570 [Nepenthes gracilis]